jgi:hypothetical protein
VGMGLVIMASAGVLGASATRVPTEA